MRLFAAQRGRVPRRPARLTEHSGGRLSFAWDTLQDAIPMNLAQQRFLAAAQAGGGPWAGNSTPYREDFQQYPREERSERAPEPWAGGCRARRERGAGEARGNGGRVTIERCRGRLDGRRGGGRGEGAGHWPGPHAPQYGSYGCAQDVTHPTGPRRGHTVRARLPLQRTPPPNSRCAPGRSAA